MRTRTTAAVAVTAAALLLAGCSSGSDNDASAKPSTKTTFGYTPQPTTTAASTVNLSTTWVPKLQALAGGTGTADCSSDSGGADCVQAISDSVDLLGQVAEAISTADATDRYPLTVAKVTELVGDADTYTKDECPGDANADIEGSPCPKNALAVVVGVSALQMVMQTDETNAGT